MDVEFIDADLCKLEVDPRYTAGLSQPVVKGFRKVMQAIRAAVDERDLHAMRGLNFKKLHGDREGQHSLNINDQFRLIVKIRQSDTGKKIAVIEIVDYH